MSPGVTRFGCPGRPAVSRVRIPNGGVRQTSIVSSVGRALDLKPSCRGFDSPTMTPRALRAPACHADAVPEAVPAPGGRPDGAHPPVGRGQGRVGEAPVRRGRPAAIRTVARSTGWRLAGRTPPGPETGWRPTGGPTPGHDRRACPPRPFPTAAVGRRGGPAAGVGPRPASRRGGLRRPDLRAYRVADPRVSPTGGFRLPRVDLTEAPPHTRVDPLSSTPPRGVPGGGHDVPPGTIRA